MSKINGIVPAIASTFKENGDFDYDSYLNLLRTLAKFGVQGVALFAIAGEYYKLNGEEEKKLVEDTVNECCMLGLTSVISITRHSAEVASKWARYVQDAGEDCLMLLPPHFLKPSASAILEHVKAINDSVSI